MVEHKGCPLISIILPTLNRPKYLTKAVSSVYDQSYPNIELIIIDDCSQKPVSDVLSSMTPPKAMEVEIIRNHKTRGANFARNIGISAADGRYIAFLDDDDWWEPDKLSKQYEVFDQSTPNVGVVSTDKRLWYPDGSSVVRPSDVSGDLTRKFLLGNPVGTFSSVTVRSEAVRQTGLPEEGLPNAQDKEWYIRLSRDWGFRNVSEPLVNQRVNHQQTQISANLQERAEISYPQIIEKHQDTLQEYGWLFERKVRGVLLFQLAYRGFVNSRIDTTLKYSLYSILTYPFLPRAYVVFLASSFGLPISILFYNLPKQYQRLIIRIFKELYFNRGN